MAQTGLLLERGYAPEINAGMNRKIHLRQRYEINILVAPPGPRVLTEQAQQLHTKLKQTTRNGMVEKGARAERLARFGWKEASAAFSKAITVALWIWM